MSRLAQLPSLSAKDVNRYFLLRFAPPTHTSRPHLHRLDTHHVMCTNEIILDCSRLVAKISGTRMRTRTSHALGLRLRKARP